MKIAVFSGTTEGRRLSAMLSSRGVGHFVFVATEYGNSVMEPDDHADVHVGRLDLPQMIKNLSEHGFGRGDVIVDATHPYAGEVSANIREASDRLGCRLIRVERGSAGVSGDDIINIRNSYVNQYNSFEEFAKSAYKLDGNILLTTGSKELERYVEAVSKETVLRTYVRVLPAVESLEICESLGFDRGHIVAMQGPFSYEMNRALMSQYDIRHIVTKESGSAGGFSEKISAAGDMGVSVHVIKRPEEPGSGTGVSVEEAFEELTGTRYIPKRKIVLAGIGMGALSGMTVETVDAIRSADAVFGAGRVLDSAKQAGLIRGKSYGMYLAKDIIGVLDCEVNITTATILFSGDTGFYSGAKEAYRELKAWDPDADIMILPGVSSVSYLAAKLGESYDDAAIVSIHGRNSLHNIENLVRTIGQNRKTFALMSGDEDVRSVAKMLSDSKMSPKLIIGRDMSYAADECCDPEEDDPCRTCLREQIVTLDVESAKEYAENGSITVLFIGEDAKDTE